MPKDSHTFPLSKSFRKRRSKVTEDDLLAFVNEQVTDYKRIRGGIIFSRSIPRNSVGKLVRKEMRKWAANEFQLQRYGRRDSSKDM